MQTKTRYYITIAILAIAAVALNLYSCKKRKQIESLSQEAPVEPVSAPADTAATETAAPVQTYIKKGAITIIKTEKPAAVGEKEKNSPLSGSDNRPSPAGSLGSGVLEKSEPSSPSVGITKENKYPTREEKAEMNAKGIILF